MRNKLIKMSSWLRHSPPQGLAMSEAGWVSTSELARLLNVSEDAMLERIKTDKKTRYSVNGDFIRAAQGHSTDLVTREALEDSWTRKASDEVPFIYHGTNPGAWEGIQETGVINSGERTHVHCALAPDSVVGKRTETPILLKISTEGLDFWESENGVLLVREIPVTAIVEVIEK